MRGLGAAFAQDLRPAARGLLRAPLFTGTALLVLALAIGAATAVFSLVDGVVGTARAYLQSTVAPASLEQLRGIASSGGGGRRGAGATRGIGRSHRRAAPNPVKQAIAKRRDSAHFCKRVGGV